ncbi:hypothetical protein AVEN_91179-1 [Araneus ventricosus]|uniref:Tc1-like transposase DDE domain-containing protein n=1 Tax=Araneus ventricosus TaxID=182803 RepID=A0A4Y2VFL0_ARAVE|nr:hypothetical protein AVEN_91179-1 [Araneus ventricosus]
MSRYDEPRFSLFQNYGRTGVGRELHEAKEPLCIVPTVQANGGSILIWVRFDGSGLGSAILCHNKMKSQHYFNEVNDQVIPSMEFFFPDGTGIFQDDNAKIQRALIIQNLFRDYQDSFSCMNWPPQSQDLNSVENLWNMLEQRLWSGSFLPSSVLCLGDKLLQIWTAIGSETIQNLIETISRRVHAIRTEGGSTKY